MRLLSFALSLVMLASAAVAAGCRSPKASGPTRITLGFTAWPGWLPWEVAKEQGLFAKNGLNVELKYFTNYTDSLLALETGALDANSQTLNDTLISVSAGAKQTVVLVNDTSTGNDKIIARDGITSVADLKGRKVDAVSASAPFTTKALQRPGSHAIATSAEFPGAIPNHLGVRPALIHDHPEAVQALVDAWFDPAAPQLPGGTDRRLRLRHRHGPEPPILGWSAG